MTNEQASEVIAITLDEIASQIMGAEMIDSDTRKGLELTIKAFTMARTALRGPVPDPSTGLLPCGCDGIPEYQVETARFQHRVSVGCPKCFASGAHVIAELGQPIDGLKMIARENWNRAMGYQA